MTAMNELRLPVVSFDRICRLCLHEKRILVDIFQGTENSSIHEKIKACAVVNLSEDDGLPTQICVPCLSNLNAAFDFKIQCEKADKILHSFCHLLVYDKAKDKTADKLENITEKPELETLNQNHIVLIKRQDEDMVQEDINYDDSEGETRNVSYIVNIVQKSKQTVEKVCIKEALNTEKEVNTQNRVEKTEQEGMRDVKKSPCPFCQKMLTRVNEHIRLLHKNKVYICKKQNCGAEFLTLKNLQSHQLKCYNMEKPYKCLKCFKQFHRKCNYKAHIVRHTNKKDFQCQLCEKAFVDSTGLRRHFLIHHEPQRETFVSVCCDKKFKTKEGLKRHTQKGTCQLQIFQVLESNSERTEIT